MITRFILSAICGLLAVSGIQAQMCCSIKGTIRNDSLRYSAQKIKKVYLTRMDEYERFQNIDSATVKNGTFTFEYKMDKDEPVMLHFITGFDNGSVSVFLEPGQVSVDVPDAAYPNASKVVGTVTNNLYAEYRSIAERCKKVQIDTLHAWKEQRGEAWLNSQEGFEERNRVGAAALIDCNADLIDFLLDHNDSPLAPLMMEREIYYMLDKAYVQQLLAALSPRLFSHPYYRSFANVVRALDLREGAEVPNITIPLLDGRKAHLSDFKGKYVLLDFWASWCGPCIKELPFLKQIYEETKDKRDRFVIVSFSIDTKDNAWRKAIKDKEIGLPEWVHGSDLQGWKSPAAKMLDVTAIPKMVLVDPEGKAVSFTLRGEEMVRRIKQILAGDLYYLDQKK